MGRLNTAPDLLNKAAETITERGQNYDKPEGERSMQATVTAFNAICRRDLTEEEGWQFMDCLKSVRAFTGSKMHADSLIDKIAYAALLAESSNKII